METNEFLAIYPRFNCLGTAFIEAALQEAECTVGKCAYTDEQRKLAIQYLTAHNSSLELTGGMDAGVVSSEKVGDLATAYSVGDSNHPDAYYQTTMYGKKFLQLRATIVVSPFVID